MAAVPAANSQGRGGADWSTTGNDAQRSGWVRTDAKISAESMAKPGFQFMWKVKVGNDALTAPSLMDRYIGYRGFRSYAFVGGLGNNITVFDSDLARVEWKKHFPVTAGAGTGSCPGSMSASVAREVPAALPMVNAGRAGGGGRGGPAKSGVGAPGEGAVTLAAALAAAQPQPNAGGRGAGRGVIPAGPAGPPRGRTPSFLNAVSTDGAFHNMYVSNGEEPEAPIKFLPANANVSGLIVVDGVAYAVTSGNCAGAPDGLYALDIATKTVASVKAPVVGTAFGPDGTVFATTTTGEVLALEPKTLASRKASYSTGQALTSAPVVFAEKDKVLIAVAAKDGSVRVIDGASLSQVAASPAGGYSGPLATWQDSAGARWILSGESALKFTGSALEAGWKASGITAPATSGVVNGVVFVAAGKSLYALDGATGKELWNSGTTMGAPVTPQGGLAIGGSAVYLGTQDGTFYAFGFPIEH